MGQVLEIKKKGLLLINKQKGVTSFSLIPKLRKLFQEKKIGHAGTLDPFATGVMVYLVGREYTRTSHVYLNSTKHYMTTLYLGIETDTYDIDGKIVGQSSLKPTLDQVLKAVEKQQGTKEQIPPMFSAKKVQGKPLYKLARKGIEIERKPQTVELKTTIISYDYPYLKLYVECSKGTYVRSIAQEIGQDLGSLAHLFELERTQCGPFTIDQCHTLEEIEKNPLKFLRK
jgi:tRNA pseudouridine55 synthase